MTQQITTPGTLKIWTPYGFQKGTTPQPPLKNMDQFQTYLEVGEPIDLYDPQSM